jgi:hypothetical protein
MGQVMGDMTAESQQMIMKWRRTEPKDSNDPTSALMADSIEEAYQIYDWLFVFEAAMVTHLHGDCTMDATAILERQEKVLNKLKTMKHETGSMQMWLQCFADAIEERETLGAMLMDEMQHAYLMQNLNKQIFEQKLVLWRGVITRTTFPQTYNALKAYITNEYSAQMTQTDRAKVIYGVISTHQKKKVELLMSTDETAKADKDKCFICDRKGHKMEKFWYHKVTVMTVPQKGTYAKIPPKEQTGMCHTIETSLYSRPCNVAGVHLGQIDFIYDSGTVSGVMGEKEMNILKNVAEEDVLIEMVTGEKSLSKMYGDTLFGKTRILQGRRGSVLVSQYATKQLYQVHNPDEDTFILKGWEHNPDQRKTVVFCPGRRKISR